MRTLSTVVDRDRRRRASTNLDELFAWYQANPEAHPAEVYSEFAYRMPGIMELQAANWSFAVAGPERRQQVSGLWNALGEYLFQIAGGVESGSKLEEEAYCWRALSAMDSANLVKLIGESGQLVQERLVELADCRGRMLAGDLASHLAVGFPSQFLPRDRAQPASRWQKQARGLLLTALNSVEVPMDIKRTHLLDAATKDMVWMCLRTRGYQFAGRADHPGNDPTKPAVETSPLSPPE